MTHQLLTRKLIIQGLFLFHMVENNVFYAEKEGSAPLNLLFLVYSIQLQPLHLVKCNIFCIQTLKTKL